MKDRASYLLGLIASLPYYGSCLKCFFRHDDENQDFSIGYLLIPKPWLQV